jgi:hypothetical protein
VKRGWVAFAAVLLLIAAKLGLMQWHAHAGRMGADARSFEAAKEGAGAVAARARPLWKPILL